jgi:predicted amidophosphoribosyltransferase
MPIASFFAPSRCLSCRAPGPALCTTCRAAIVVLDGPLCTRCGAPTALPVAACRECAGRPLAFGHARAAVSHVGPVIRLLAVWKDRGLPVAGSILADLLVASLPPPDADALVAVPAAGDRKRWRGVDGPAALAVACSSAWGLPVRACLERVGTRPQRGLTVTARRSNARRSFVAVGVAPPRVVLVDDVYTTGATASACASVLRRAGARQVDVVVAARAVRRR